LQREIQRAQEIKKRKQDEDLQEKQEKIEIKNEIAEKQQLSNSQLKDEQLKSKQSESLLKMIILQENQELS